MPLGCMLQSSMVDLRRMVEKLAEVFFLPCTDSLLVLVKVESSTESRAAVRLIVGVYVALVR